MATAHWRTGYSVEDLYSKQDVGWSFYQLVRLLLPTQVEQDELLEQLTQYVEFSSSQGQDFPAGDVRGVTFIDSKQVSGVTKKAQVTCNSYNIAALDGPLPEPFVDMLRDDQIQGEGAMNAFINLFNNRIQALRYLVHAYTNNSLTNSEATKTLAGKFLLSLSGHLAQAHRDLHQQSDDTYISLAGDLANRRMTLPAISKLLKRVLGVQLLSMNSLLGRWLRVESSDHTHLGKANHRLGAEATLGKKIWDQQAMFELVIGPLSVSRIQELVPGGKDANKLRKLLEWICDKRCDCKVTLVCRSESASETKISSNKNETNTLGYGTWLTGKKNDDQRISYLLNLVH